MIIPGSSYWNLGVGLKPGDILNDKEGLATFRNWREYGLASGKNMRLILRVKEFSGVSALLPDGRRMKW